MAQSKPDVAAPAPFVVAPATIPYTHTLILLHGLGSNGEKFGRELLETGTTSDSATLTQIFPRMKFIFPTSRWRRSSAFGRSILRQWFNIACLSDPSYRKELQIKGLVESAPEVLQLLQQEQDVYRIPACNIIFGGISQGCAMSLSVLLGLGYSIGGFIGISGFLPFQSDLVDVIEESVTKVDNEDNFFDGNDRDKEPKDPAVLATLFERDLLSLPAVDNDDATARLTPIFFGHGTADEKVPPSLGEAMTTTMNKAGYRVELNVYDIGHWYKVPDEIDDIVSFIQSKVV